MLLEIITTLLIATSSVSSGYVQRSWEASGKITFKDQINDLLRNGQVRSTLNRRNCMRRCMKVDEAKEVCLNRSLWQSIVSAYPYGIRAWTEGCSHPPEPAHGSYEVTGSTQSRFGDIWPTKVAFACWTGYTLVGAQAAVCVDGRWSEPIPQCVEQSTAAAGPNSKQFSYMTSWSTKYFKEFGPQFTSQNSQPQQTISQLEQVAQLGPQEQKLIVSQLQQSSPQQQQYTPQQQQPVLQQQLYTPQQQQPVPQQQYTPQQQQPVPQQQQYTPQQLQPTPQQQQFNPQQQQFTPQQQQQFNPQQQQTTPQQQQFRPQQQQSSQQQQLVSQLERIISQSQQLSPEERRLLISQLQQLRPQQQCFPQQQLRKGPLSTKGVQLKKTSVRTGGCILPPYPEMGFYRLSTVMNPLPSTHQLTTNLTFSCDYSRVLEGPRVILCVDGRWSDNSPYCRERRPEEGAVSTGGIGGRDAVQRELPWHVGIYDKSTGTHEQVCGGTIVSRNRIISAAHCFWDDLEKLRSPSQFSVGAGKLYRGWDEMLDKDSVQKADVSNLRIPPRYQHSATSFQEDIAIVTLTKALTFNDFVMPALLDFDPAFDAKHLRNGNRGKVGGWGLITEDGMPATKLQVLDLPYVAIEKCISENEPDFLNYITADKICAGFRNGTALCMGDSGGGLVFSENDNGNQRHYLRGIVSTAPTNDNACNIYAWTTFTHVLRQELFIKQ